MFDLTSHTTLMTCLACVALNPGLRSILVLDAPSTGLQQLADMQAELLRAATDQHVRQYQLAAFESDDDVWGALHLPWHNTKSGTLAARRLFSAERNAQELQLIVIPDLTALSLVAARTVTMLLGADVVHLERNGFSSRWHPQQCWIAACEHSDIGKLSPHLLDRFVLRLSWSELVPPDAGRVNETAITHLLTNVPREPFQQTTPLPPTYLQQVAHARHQQIEILGDVLTQVLEYTPAESYYPRRMIALARFAQTLAQLSGTSSLRTEDIDMAAHILGFSRQIAISDDMQLTDTVTSSTNSNAADDTAQLAADEIMQAASQLQEAVQLQTVQLPETVYTPSGNGVAICSNPFPEDDAPIERDKAALKLPFTHYALLSSARGAIIGVEESDTLYDLALVSTILAASRFQKVRQNRYRLMHKQAYSGLLIEHMDLRRYRRSRPSEQVFLLLLDYTSTRGNNQWLETLIPYLHAAYIARAGIIIVKVGAADAIFPLRAEVVKAKSILVPRVGLALEASRGQATPLAHGLSTALEQLQRILQHGRSTAHKVTFIAISDGRGNVPLAISMRGEKDAIITREGIDDALREARKIRVLNHVESIVLNPQPDYYPDLPERLAEALGATLLPIPRNDETQEVVSL